MGSDGVRFGSDKVQLGLMGSDWAISYTRLYLGFGCQGIH